MSMIGTFLRISAPTLAQLLEDPDAAEAVLFPADGPEPRVLASVDSDKAWHLIHFLLTGDAREGSEPLQSAVLGGEVLVDMDLGYGPPRYLVPEKVAEVAAALAAVSPEALWSRFDAAKVAAAAIYPQDWEGGDEDRRYVLGAYTELQSFYADAAQSGDAVIQFIS